MTKERLEQLLIKCMDWIEEDGVDCDETLDTFQHLGFEPDELKELGFGYLNNVEEPEWLNEKEKQLIDILEDAKKYCKGELELDLNDEGIWMAWDYREDLGGAFPIEAKGFNDRIISISEAENRGIDVRRCCDECGISYVG